MGSRITTTHYFDWRDLKPSLTATISFGRMVARRLRQGL